jgi:two-component system, chemotaxis family, protein-glutamate methylesterase/glutaminase
MANAVPSTNGAPRGVVAVGASAGGVEALTRFASNLPSDLPYAILVALHIPPAGPSVLARIIDRSGPLPAETATDGAPIRAGRIYVAAPDRHLLVHDHRTVVSEGPTENGHRPAINALFRAVALTFGPHAVGVLMSGVLDDGVLGAAAIRARGGTVVVQSPEDALFPAMPSNALHAGVVDRQAAATDIGPMLKELGVREIEEREMEPDVTMEIENRIAMGRRFDTTFDSDALGPHSGYTCPDCNGSLVALRENSYRCRVGHAWTTESLLEARDDEVNGALWVAVRSLEEKASLSRRMADSVRPGMISQRYRQLADEAEHAMNVLAGRLRDTRIESGDRGAG